MYAYNGDGLRMSKTVGGSGEPFIWDVSGSLPTLIADGATSYLMGPNGLPIEQISSAGTVLYYLPDQLGSTRGLVDPTGALVGQFTYDAYGRLVNAVGTVTNPVFGFAGQFVDSESGLYYMRARYYDPATGQLISIDPMAGSTRTPYSYVGGDPVNFVDPTGLYTGKQVRKAAEEMRRILEGFSSITNLLSLTCSAIEVSLAGGAAGAGPEGEAVVAPEEGAIWAACSQVLGDLSLAADVLKTGTAVASCQNGGNCGQILVDVIGLLVSGSQAHFHDLRGLGKPGKLISDAIHSTINSAFGWLGTLAVHYSCPSA
jgi:RHS repeat-associated protein